MVLPQGILETTKNIEEQDFRSEHEDGGVLIELAFVVHAEIFTCKIVEKEQYYIIHKWLTWTKAWSLTSILTHFPAPYERCRVLRL